MQTYSYNLINTGDQRLITVFLPGRRAQPAGGDHPSFDAIVAKMLEADALQARGSFAESLAVAESALDLFDVADTVARKFESVAGSDRLTVRSGKIYLDGDEADNAITDHIIRMMENGEDFAPLVRFYERLLTNPLGHAREALYPWMQGNGGFTITPTGLLVGYKSVYADDTDEDRGYKPTRDGGGVVNGVEFETGPLWQKPGDVVEMPRSIVLHEPSQACGEGLHIGTSGYAYGFSGNVVLEVHFDPRDVVNVPNNANKIRVCRYTVVGPIEQAYTQPIVPDYGQYDTVVPYNDDLEEERCEDCGYLIEDCECDDFEGCEGCGGVEDCYCEDEPEDPFDSEDEDTGWMGDSKPNDGPTADDLGIVTDAVADAMQALSDKLEETEGLVTQAATDARDALGRWVAGRVSQRDPKTGRFNG